MKQLAHIVASFVFLVLYTVSANAQYDFQVGGLYYKLTSVETCSVAKTYTEDFTKNSNGTVSPNKSSYSGDIVIPSHVQYRNRDLKVTAINESAFFKSTITSVKIERGGVQEIGRSAFADCQQLRVVEMGDGVTTIGNGAFYFCRNLEFLHLPENGLKAIGAEAFEDCGVPRNEIRIASTCTAIGWNAFKFRSQSGSRFYFSDGSSTINIYERALPIYGKFMYVGRNLALNSADIYCYEEIVFGDSVTKMPKYNVPYTANGEKVQQLTIGQSIKTVPRIDSDDLRIITVNSTEPPQAEGFPDKVYLDAILYVPAGCAAKYQNADVWKNFWTIKEKDTNSNSQKTKTTTNSVFPEQPIRATPKGQLKGFEWLEGNWFGRSFSGAATMKITPKYYQLAWDGPITADTPMISYTISKINDDPDDHYWIDPDESIRLRKGDEETIEILVGPIDIICLSKGDYKEEEED